MKLSMIVFVVINSTGVDSINLWRVPASWSAWQCVRINLSTKLDEIPLFSKSDPVNGGGSTMTPFPSIQIINPDVDSEQSKPWLAPIAVIPKAGGTKLRSS